METLAGWMLIAWIYRKWTEWQERKVPPKPPEPPVLSQEEYDRLYAEAERKRAGTEGSPLVRMDQL